MDDDARDAASVLEPGARPGLPGVGRSEHSPAGRDVAPRERLARPRIDDVHVTRRHRDRANGGDGLLVEHRVPMDTAVGRLPESTRCRAGVVRVRVARHAGDGGDTVPLRTDVAVLESLINRRVDGLGSYFLE